MVSDCRASAPRYRREEEGGLLSLELAPQFNTIKFNSKFYVIVVWGPVYESSRDQGESPQAEARDGE